MFANTLQPKPNNFIQMHCARIVEVGTVQFMRTEFPINKHSEYEWAAYQYNQPVVVGGYLGTKENAYQGGKLFEAAYAALIYKM